ncbi:MAG: response regulator [Acidobacteria bacterium]|nr:response regulator [Acidobacteriota bacterium]
MPSRDSKRILAVVDDLFFSVKISDAAKRAGMEVEFVKSDQDLLAKATSLPAPALVILDLNFESVGPLGLIRKLKSTGELSKISLIGYLSHVQGELKQKAHESGCDMVMARSAFSQNLPQLLKRHSGSL